MPPFLSIKQVAIHELPASEAGRRCEAHALQVVSFLDLKLDEVLYGKGYYIHAEPEAKVALMQKAEYKCSVKTIEKWVRERTSELHPG